MLMTSAPAVTFAFNSACRNDPVPLLFVFVTVNIVLNGCAWANSVRSNAIATPITMTSATTKTTQRRSNLGSMLISFLLHSHRQIDSWHHTAKFHRADVAGIRPQGVALIACGAPGCGRIDQRTAGLRHVIGGHAKRIDGQ